MKKKFAYLFIAISVALLVLYLFRYERALTIAEKIPRVATEVIHLNLRQIEHHIVLDAIKNPSKYINFKAKKNDAISLNKTIEIPRNLLFFTNNTTLKDVWFSSFVEIKDEDQLKRYLTEKGFEAFSDKKLELYRKEKLVVAMSNKTLLIAYSMRQVSSIVRVIQAIFNETDFYKDEADLVQLIADSKSDIAYASASTNFLEANFKNGLLEINGKMASDLFIEDTYASHRENSIGLLNTRIHKGHHAFRPLFSDKNAAKFTEYTKLSIDSVMNNWNGRVSFNLTSITGKTDTIVTYDYDDDFNKIKKKSVQKRLVPTMNFQVGVRAHLFEYLSNKNAIQFIDTDTIFTLFPLYTLYAKLNQDVLNIYTDTYFYEPLRTKKTYRLQAYFNIEEYLNDPMEFSLIPTNNTYVSLLKESSIQISATNDLSAEVHLKNSDRNFIGQMVKP